MTDRTSTPAVTAFLGLGANVGDPLATLEAAVWAIDDIDGVAVDDTSAVYRTPPWPPADDPRAVAQDDFLNLVVRVVTSLAPHELLAQTQLVEAAFGRDRGAEVRWGPRVLDVDVLLYGDVVLDGDELVVPHPHLTERAFALLPLAEVHPGGHLPDGRRVAALLTACPGMDAIELDVRLSDVPGRRIERPEGPTGPRASFDRPERDALSREHGDAR